MVFIRKLINPGKKSMEIEIVSLYLNKLREKGISLQPNYPGQEN